MQKGNFAKTWNIGFRVSLYLISLFIIFQFIGIGVSFMFGNSLSMSAGGYPVLGFLIFITSLFLFIYSIGWAFRDLHKRIK